MRVFIGFDCSIILKNKIVAFQEKQIFEGKCVDKDNIHLTMLFLGEVSQQQLNLLSEKMQQISFKAFTMQTKAIKKKRDLVIVEIVDDSWFHQIHQMLTDLCTSCGITVEQRRFFPHITIARKNNQSIYQRFIHEENLDECHIYLSNFVEGKRIYTKARSYKAIKKATDK